MNCESWTVELSFLLGLLAGVIATRYCLGHRWKLGRQLREWIRDADEGEKEKLFTLLSSLPDVEEEEKRRFWDDLPAVGDEWLPDPVPPGTFADKKEPREIEL